MSTPIYNVQWQPLIYNVQWQPDNNFEIIIKADIIQDKNLS